MRYKYLFNGLLAICLIGACSAPKNKTVITSAYPKLNFDSSIKELAIRDSGMETNEGYLTDTLFLKLFEHSGIYKEDAIRFLQNSNHTSEQLLICILSMQNLEINDYIDFSEAFITLYEKGNIPEWVLTVLISPNFLKKHVVIENYDKTNVIKLLKRIKGNGSASKKLRQNITEILSGQAWSELKNSE